MYKTIIAHSGSLAASHMGTLSTPCQVELLNCMSAASKPEEAGPECFAQFGVDWAPIQVEFFNLMTKLAPASPEF